MFRDWVFEFTERTLSANAQGLPTSVLNTSKADTLRSSDANQGHLQASPKQSSDQKRQFFPKSRPPMENPEFCDLAEQIRESSVDFRQVRGLSQDRFDFICRLLEDQSPADLLAFKKATESFMAKGYQLTSLVADIRCSAEKGAPKVWKCEVRPKIGAKPLRRKR